MLILCREKIEENRLNNYSTVEVCFVDFDKTTNEFKMTGGKLDEQEKLRYRLWAPPPSYSCIGDFLDVIPEEQKTFDYVCSKTEENNVSTCDSDMKNNVSTCASKTIVHCFICGKTGHLKKDCWHGQRHNQGQQRRRGQRGLERGYNRGGFYRGHCRGRKQIHFRGQGQSSGESPNNFSSESWTAEVCGPEINQIVGVLTI